jgi:hypothetical protein
MMLARVAGKSKLLVAFMQTAARKKLVHMCVLPRQPAGWGSSSERKRLRT